MLGCRMRGGVGEGGLWCHPGRWIRKAHEVGLGWLKEGRKFLLLHHWVVYVLLVDCGYSEEKIPYQIRGLSLINEDGYFFLHIYRYRLTKHNFFFFFILQQRKEEKNT